MMNCFAFTKFTCPRCVPLAFGQSGNAVMSTLGFSRQSLRERQVALAARGLLVEKPQLKEGVRA